MERARLEVVGHVVGRHGVEQGGKGRVSWKREIGTFRGKTVAVRMGGGLHSPFKVLIKGRG